MALVIISRFLIRKLPPKYNYLFYLVLCTIAITCYAENEPNKLLLFLVSVTINVLAGRIIFNVKSDKIKKIILFVIIALDVFGLIYFKYMVKLGKALIPLGLSFLTFREISYLIDVYKKKVPPLKSPIEDIAYITLFTQIQSGPIMTYNEFINSDIYKHEIDKETFTNNTFDGIRRIMIGIIKKSIIADSLLIITNTAFYINPQSFSVPYAWLGAICYSLQLYYDFSGYSDIAIGFTNIIGFKCPENFNYPYASRSITDFWRRWHITLGAWFKEYVYFPLGGSRTTQLKIFRNLFVVWLLTGLWHGFNIQFLIWAMIHFIFVTIEHFSAINKAKNKLIKGLWRITTLIVIMIAWVMFKSVSVEHGLLYIKSMFIPNNSSNLMTADNIIRNYWYIIGAAVLFSLPLIPKLKERFSEKKTANIYNIISAITVIVLFFISLTLSANSRNNTFVYANF